MKKLILSFLGAGAVLAFAHAYADTVLIDDTYHSGQGSFNGRTPDTTHLTGTTWTMAVDNYGSGVNTTDHYAFIKGDGAAVISIASNPSALYVEPAVLNISADVDYSGITYESGYEDERGVGLGFYSNDTGHEGSVPGSVGDGHAFSDFSGIVVSAGGLSLFSNGVYEATAAYYGGSFISSGDLSYDYNTATGAITDLTYAGHNYTSDFSSYALVAGDDYAGWGVSDYTGSGAGVTYNFSVSAVTIPEPGTDALFALGGCLVLAGWLRLRRSKA